jgi:hypothetical protein
MLGLAIAPMGPQRSTTQHKSPEQVRSLHDGPHTKGFAKLVLTQGFSEDVRWVLSAFNVLKIKITLLITILQKLIMDFYVFCVLSLRVVLERLDSCLTISTDKKWCRLKC